MASAPVRCAQHGLLAAADGSCALCRSARDRRVLASRALGLALGIVVVGLAAFYVRTAEQVSGPARTTLQVAVRSALPGRRNTPAARAAADSEAVVGGPLAQPSASSPSQAPVPVSASAEDRFLGIGPSSVGQVPSSVRPPEPPRATVDALPDVADDPRDFELHER